jgi:electron transport complex protein RnfE
VLPDYPGFLVAILPPGAFIALGLFVAGKQWLDARTAAREKSGSEKSGSDTELFSGISSAEKS